MTVIIHHEMCNYCGACVSVCHVGALELFDTYLRVNTEKCKESCKLCSSICPLGALSNNA